MHHTNMNMNNHNSNKQSQIINLISCIHCILFLWRYSIQLLKQKHFKVKTSNNFNVNRKICTKIRAKIKIEIEIEIYYKAYIILYYNCNMIQLGSYGSNVIAITNMYKIK